LYFLDHVGLSTYLETLATKVVGLQSLAITPNELCEPRCILFHLMV